MKPEAKVGLLFLAAIGLMVGFAWTIGALNPLSDSYDLRLLYNFAGGIEVGSPVRVMGIKVGKVKDIRFDPSMKDEHGQEVKLEIRISVEKKAWETVRKNSQFYINLAGVIGEKFVEITPGNTTEPAMAPGQVVRGIDPPRIDQLISQSYGLAGKIMEMVEKNEGSVTNTIQLLDKLVTNLNKTLMLIDKTTQKTDIGKLLDNAVKLTGDLSKVSSRLTTPEADRTIDLVHKLIWRLDDLDKQAIKKFFQEDGIKAKLF
ncbi:MAG: MlaD family protein [Bdellovibrionales bacterium]|nr:MlaD family protein [Bdellovibrionales bacterium]